MKDTDYSNKASRPPLLPSIGNVRKFETDIEKLEKYSFVPMRKSA